MTSRTQSLSGGPFPHWPLTRVLRISYFPTPDYPGCNGSPYSFPPCLFNFKTVQGATDTMYFASHLYPLSGSSMRVYSWPEAGGLSSFDRTIDSWYDGVFPSCPWAGDGNDMCGRLDDRMTGGYVSGGVVAFLWTAPQGGGGVTGQLAICQSSAIQPSWPKPHHS